VARALPVKPEFGPTLPQLVGRRATWALLALAALVAAVAGFVALGGASDDRTVVVDEGPVAFNLRHGPGLAEARPQDGELLRLAGRRGELAAVRPLRLPAYRGAESGVLPLVADREAIARLPWRLDDVELVGEGRARVNEAPGYSVAYRARRAGRRVYGRVVFLLPPESPGARDGLRLDLLAPRSGAVPSAGAVGATGQLKAPYRTLRFGTEGP
jgi:hypothetical protein